MREPRKLPLMKSTSVDLLSDDTVSCRHIRKWRQRERRVSRNATQRRGGRQGRTYWGAGDGLGEGGALEGRGVQVLKQQLVVGVRHLLLSHHAH
jgi:hypothetical protein